MKKMYEELSALEKQMNAANERMRQEIEAEKTALEASLQSVNHMEHFKSLMEKFYETRGEELLNEYYSLCWEFCSLESRIRSMESLISEGFILAIEAILYINEASYEASCVQTEESLNKKGYKSPNTYILSEKRMCRKAVRCHKDYKNYRKF